MLEDSESHRTPEQSMFEALVVDGDFFQCVHF